jgi:hypothetical protein
MTKDEAVAFLENQGHAAQVRDLDEDLSLVSFKYQGTRIVWKCYRDDVDFLCLECSFSLEEAVRDELAVLRNIARLQRNIKVAKLKYEDKAVCAAVEQLLDFENFAPRVFWRLVELAVFAARECCAAMRDTIVPNDAGAAEAAERFTQEIMTEMHLKDGNE